MILVRETLQDYKIIMGVYSDAAKQTAKDLAGGAVAEVALQHKDQEIGQSYKAPTVDKEYAQRMASSYNDMPTIKSTIGIHPVEEHFARSGPRHPLGSSVPR